MKHFALVLPEACKPEDIIVEELEKKEIPYEKWRTLPRLKNNDTCIGLVSFGPQMSYMALFDDEGLVNDTNPKPTINVTGHLLCGPVAMCSSDVEGNSIGFTADEVEKLLPVVKKYLVGHLNLPTPEPFLQVTPLRGHNDFEDKMYVNRELKRLENNNYWSELC